MDDLLQVVVVVFMLFLCALCLFAVVVIVRDIVYESAKTRRERLQDDEETRRLAIIAAAKEVARLTEEEKVSSKQDVENTITPCVATEVQAEVGQDIAAESVVDADLSAEKDDCTEAPVTSEVAAADALEEDLDDGDIDEGNPDAVSFNRGSLTMEEKYDALDIDFKGYFDDIAMHALSKADVKESKRSGSYDYKIGAYRVLRMMIKRGEIVCEFRFIDHNFNAYASEANVKIKQAATQIRVLEPSAVDVCKDGIDLVCRQIDEDKERKKDLARAKRREKRRLAKQTEASVADTDDVESADLR